MRVVEEEQLDGRKQERVAFWVIENNVYVGGQMVIYIIDLYVALEDMCEGLDGIVV